MKARYTMLGEKIGTLRLSQNGASVILRVDHGIQKSLNTLNSRFRRNAEMLWKYLFWDSLGVPIFVSMLTCSESRSK
jgi:hypothetical protein